jgi:hypothetical protein
MMAFSSNATARPNPQVLPTVFCHVDNLWAEQIQAQEDALRRDGDRDRCDPAQPTLDCSEDPAHPAWSKLEPSRTGRCIVRLGGTRRDHLLPCAPRWSLWGYRSLAPQSRLQRGVPEPSTLSKQASPLGLLPWLPALAGPDNLTTLAFPISTLYLPSGYQRRIDRPPRLA